MHKALLIYEVLDCIIDPLEQDTISRPFMCKDTQKVGRRALVALARTCRIFSEPALDTLWRRLDSLEPFILCLPAKASYGNGRTPTFDDEEWSIVSRYAPRVQELRLGFRDKHSPKVLESLWFRTTLLLPSLKRLEWDYNGYDNIHLIRLLLSPLLVHLHVSLGDGDHPSVMGFLECCHILCPNLVSIHLSQSGVFPDVTTAVSRAISRTRNLKALSCNFLVEATLKHIISSRQLERLHLRLRDHQPDDLRRFAVHVDIPFENLRTLDLCFKDLSSIIPYLRSSGQPFEHILFGVDITPAPEVLHGFFTALASPVRQRTLRKIFLSVVGSEAEPMPLQAIDFGVLRLLTDFNLDRLNMDLPNPVTLTDDELVHLAGAWPDLEMFYLNENGWDHHSTSNIPTLQGLLLVIERCPKLRDLGLCVDARRVPLLSEVESSIRNRAIETLCLADSPIQESAIEGVAQFLLHHFPDLRSIQQVSHDYQAMWNSVRRLTGLSW